MSDEVREVSASVKVNLDRSMNRKVRGPSGSPRAAYGLRIEYQRGNWGTDRVFVTAECRDDAFLVTGAYPKWVTEIIDRLRPDILDRVRKAVEQ